MKKILYFSVSIMFLTFLIYILWFNIYFSKFLLYGKDSEKFFNGNTMNFFDHIEEQVVSDENKLGKSINFNDDISIECDTNSDGLYYCLKVDNKKQTKLEKVYNLENKSSFKLINGYNNEFYINFTKELYRIDINSLEIIEKVILPENIRDTFVKDDKLNILFISGLLITYDNSFVEIERKYTDINGYNLYIILLSNNLIGAFDSNKFSLFDDNGKLIKSIDIYYDNDKYNLFVNKVYNINQNEISIFYYDVFKEIKIGQENYKYSQLYMIKFNIDTLEVSKTEVMKLGFYTEYFRPYLTDVDIDSEGNYILTAYINPEKQYGSPYFKGGLVLVKINNNGTYVGSKIFELINENRYYFNIYKNNVSVEDNNIIITGSFNKYKESHFNFTIPTSNDNFVYNFSEIDFTITNYFNYYKYVLIIICVISYIILISTSVYSSKSDEKLKDITKSNKVDRIFTVILVFVSNFSVLVNHFAFSSIFIFTFLNFIIFNLWLIIRKKIFNHYTIINYILFICLNLWLYFNLDQLSKLHDAKLLGFVIMFVNVILCTIGALVFEKEKAMIK